MRAGNSCKKSLSLRKFSLSVLGIFLLIGCLVSPAGAAYFWDITVVDSVGNTGHDTSLAILPSGQPAISYYDWTNQDLKYAWYDGSAWQTTTVDSAGNAGKYTSLAILPSGHAAISYYDFTNNDLKYAWYNGSAWHMELVDSGGTYTSLAILPSGYPAISYCDITNNALKYAWYDSSTWQTSTVESCLYCGGFEDTSLAILPSSHPGISYWDKSNEEVKYAWYDGSAWQTISVEGGLGYYGGHTSLAILPSGQPAISYYGGDDLNYAWYDGSIWQTIKVDSQGIVGYFTSLAILPSGQPAISYMEGSRDYNLKYAWYDGSAWQTTIVDSLRYTGQWTSLAILPLGQTAISYWSSGDLNYATPPDIAFAPVPLAANYTATAHTDLGGTTIEIDGPAYNEGYIWSELGEDARAYSSVSLETTTGGHLRGLLSLSGQDGYDCEEMGPCWDISCGDANGSVAGTIVLGISESYPADSELELALEVLVGGDPGDAENYHLKLWRGVSLLGQIDPSAPEPILVPIFAGETLTFELFASEEDWYGDYQDYDRSFEFRIIIRGPANLDGKGTVDFRDYAIFALRWLDTGCVDPTWCGKADLDKSGDVNLPDLKIFAGHWLE